ncbi:MAG: tRNA uridine-5-carboxymethylaminomethyl(34) synthesis enzyme MnmG [Acidobacteria bacterium]|nr:tRNA uridine-5-carboxymethylaminomethyl(34) synthesis enzyme MnmG [Acidobacteriota bacterium]
MQFNENFEVIVIGAGHAGCEAAAAAAKMGRQTALVTINLDLIAQMSCNPAVGGIAKGHIVREIDALGGMMGKVIDKAGIQFRVLNRSRGPAVQSPRAQADRGIYRTEMRKQLEAIPSLFLRQGEVVEILTEQGRVIGIEFMDGRKLSAKAIVIATGTFLNGTIHIGTRTFSAGRSGEIASILLSQSIAKLGFSMARLKTGTPPRLDARTIDFSQFEIQPGDDKPTPFSFQTKEINQKQLPCYIAYTSEKTHNIIKENISRSPLYSGQIQSIGPRYCPSIEDKIVKFADKDRHQLFLEPEGYETNEVYLNGFSTSLPLDVQEQAVRKIPGLELVAMIRPGYAIEYDMVDPTELTASLETKKIKGLFHAGQINGTTGYEEAACQGLIAGINAALMIEGRERLVLPRDLGYIGVLIDDLISRGVDEPYRMFTSRSEVRLLLRMDNADQRLTTLGRQIGLVTDQDFQNFQAKQDRISELKQAFNRVKATLGSEATNRFCEASKAKLNETTSLAKLAKRPEVTAEHLSLLLPANILDTLDPEELSVTVNDIKYAGYIEMMRVQTDRLAKAQERKIPNTFEYSSIPGLSREMVEKLSRVRPETIGQASRIPGVTSAALSIINLQLELRHRSV